MNSSVRTERGGVSCQLWSADRYGLPNLKIRPREYGRLGVHKKKMPPDVNVMQVECVEQISRFCIDVWVKYWWTIIHRMQKQRRKLIYERGCVSTNWNSTENGGAHRGERVGDIWVKRVLTAFLLIINWYRVIIRINTEHPKLGTDFGPRNRVLARYYPRLRLGQ